MSNTESMSESKSKPKIILHLNPPKITDKSYGVNPAQATREANTSMAGSSGERLRKARRVNHNSASRRSSGLANASQCPEFEPCAASSGADLNASRSAGHFVGNDRSGDSGSPIVAGPSTVQTKRSAGRKVSKNEARIASKAHRVSGMPSAMPRSDTPPPQFDITNPYSAFSNEPAPAQRRSPGISGPADLFGALTSLPSDVVPSVTVGGFVQDQTRHSAAQLDHRDPSWRHPWGVPVEPLPPILSCYIHSQEAANFIDKTDASEQGKEFDGIDEHSPLGYHHLDLAFTNYLIENQQHENNYAGSLSTLRPSDNITGSSNDLAVYNDQHLVLGHQTGATNAQSLLVAGDITVFPNYPYGFDQFTLNQTRLQVQSKPLALNALMHLTDNAHALAKDGANKQDAKHSSLAASIMDSLVPERAQADISKKKQIGEGEAKAPDGLQNQQSQHLEQSQQAQRNQSNSKPSKPGQKDLALNNLKVAKVSPTGEPTCTFCRYDCDWGISNENFFLDADASTGFCQECSNIDTGSFFEELTSILKSRNGEASRAALEYMKKPVQSGATPQQDSRWFSSIDANEFTKFIGPMFCKSCPWGQIDIEKARICNNHRNEKFAIIKHRRHQKFRQISYAMPDDLLSPDKIRRMNINDAEDRLRADVIKGRELGANYSKNKCCMVCTGLATDVCVHCPLRLCSTCSTFLKNICKGYLDNLFYHYERHHIRNDAFLLRSDGSGF